MRLVDWHNLRRAVGARGAAAAGLGLSSASALLFAALSAGPAGPPEALFSSLFGADLVLSATGSPFELVVAQQRPPGPVLLVALCSLIARLSPAALLLLGRAWGVCSVLAFYLLARQLQRREHAAAISSALFAFGLRSLAGYAFCGLAGMLPWLLLSLVCLVHAWRHDRPAVALLAGVCAWAGWLFDARMAVPLALASCSVLIAGLWKTFHWATSRHTKEGAERPTPARTARGRLALVGFFGLGLGLAIGGSLLLELAVGRSAPALGPLLRLAWPADTLPSIERLDDILDLLSQLLARLLAHAPTVSLLGLLGWFGSMPTIRAGQRTLVCGALLLAAVVVHFQWGAGAPGDQLLFLPVLALAAGHPRGPLLRLASGPWLPQRWLGIRAAITAALLCALVPAVLRTHARWEILKRQEERTWADLRVAAAIGHHIARQQLGEATTWCFGPPATAVYYFAGAHITPPLASSAAAPRGLSSADARRALDALVASLKHAPPRWVVLPHSPHWNRARQLMHWLGVHYTQHRALSRGGLALYESRPVGDTKTGRPQAGLDGASPGRFNPPIQPAKRTP